jgi:hypothetical protein
VAIVDHSTEGETARQVDAKSSASCGWFSYQRPLRDAPAEPEMIGAKMRFRTSRVLLMPMFVATGLTAAAFAAPISAHDDGRHGSGLTGAQREVIRDATKHFKDVNVAIAAGYVPTEDCVAAPGLGGMGYHYVNPVLAADAKVDPTLPEILVYYRDSNNRLKLGSVEYFVADADQNLATDGDRPTLMGHPFEGPMPGHSPDMPVHYDLHAWVFKSNPLGNLATWNPEISCPAP